jgi:ribosomal-protein-alanine N-acetyltransferase
LERICFLEDAWPWIDVLAALTFPQTVRIKAEGGGRLIGFVIGDRRWHKKTGWIASIGVHPDARRQGLGQRLLLACEQELATPKVRLVLRLSNTDAKSLYDQCGYAEINRWKKYYANGEDGLVMEKDLNLEPS